MHESWGLVHGAKKVRQTNMTSTWKMNKNTNLDKESSASVRKDRDKGLRGTYGENSVKIPGTVASWGNYKCWVGASVRRMDYAQWTVADRIRRVTTSH